MSGIEIFLIIFSAICVLAVLASRMKLTYPIMFVVGGLALGVAIPELSKISIPPHLILFVFLPPLLMEAAYFTSLRDFRASFVSIFQLAVGLVVATVLMAGFLMPHLLPGMTFALGCVVGAIISPPDAVAAVAMLRQVRIPKRIVTILEGESLVNDATGLVLYGFAVAAVLSGTFSFQEAGTQFAWMAVGGIGIGLSIGIGFVTFFPYIREPSIEILSTFLVPYVAYILAEEVHASGVLAVVTAGLFITWNSPKIFTSEFRLHSVAIWKMVVFVLNALVFMLIGLQAPSLIGEFTHLEIVRLLKVAALLTLGALLIRILWVFIVGYSTRWLIGKVRRRKPDFPAWQNAFVVAWPGMRGVVSLATALALPYMLMDAEPFPFRNEILFITLCVILFTLVGQGLTLPLILKKLPLTFNPRLAYEDWYARVYAARQALSRLNELAEEYDIHGPALDRVRSFYEDRIESLGDGPNTPLAQQELPGAHTHPLIRAEHTVWQQVLRAEQEAVVALRKSFHIGDDVMHDLLREVDLLAHRFK